MPRKARNEGLATRTARLRLEVRREPYWQHFQEGRAIGYRRARGGKAGTWIARFYDPAGERLRKYSALGTADDLLDADGVSTLTFSQAQEAAASWFREIARNNGRVIATVTVQEAMTAYVADYAARGGKALSGLETTINAHVLPALSDKQLSKLTAASIRSWHRALATVAARVRTGKKKRPPEAQSVIAPDADGQRARRASANRILTVLKAALNLAYRDGRVSSDDAWRRVLPFKNVEQAKIRYLNDGEAVRLINSAATEFRPMIVGALISGARYSELTRFRVADFDEKGGTLHVRISKTGKPRHIMLTDEGIRFFSGHCLGKTAHDLILTKPDGGQWGKSEQMRPMRAACKAAKIIPAVGYHILRHTHASRLAMAAVPLSVVAAQLGNSETICAKHYAHLSPGYLAETIRTAFGPLGIVPLTNVKAITG